MNSDIKFGLMTIVLATYFFIRSISDIRKGKIISRFHGSKQIILSKKKNTKAFYLTAIIHLVFQISLISYGSIIVIMEIKKHV